MSNTYRPTRPLSQVEVEQRILAVVEEMETRTHEFRELSERAAEAEANYRLDHDRATLALIQHQDVKMTVGERDARVGTMIADRHRTYLLTKAARDSCRESLSSLREQLGGLRTLSASIRGQV